MHDNSIPHHQCQYHISIPSLQEHVSTAMLGTRWLVIQSTLIEQSSTSHVWPVCTANLSTRCHGTRITLARPGVLVYMFNGEVIMI